MKPSTVWHGVSEVFNHFMDRVKGEPVHLNKQKAPFGLVLDQLDESVGAKCKNWVSLVFDHSFLFYFFHSKCFGLFDEPKQLCAFMNPIIQ